MVDCRRSIRVRPRRNTRYELRFHHGPWWHPDPDRHYVDNVPAGDRVRAIRSFREMYRHPGPHAHGRAVTVNPWMNPVVTRHGVSPDRWWLRRSRRSEPVHRSRRDPVVRAFRHHGFRWDTRRQAYGRFVLR